MNCHKIVLALILMLKLFCSALQNDCIPRSYGRSSIVCVCNATYCDVIPQPEKLLKGQYLSYTSTQNGLRYKMEKGEFRPVSDVKVDNIIHIDSTTRYQTVIGWGGSFTDATGINIYSLNNATSNNLLRSYFSKDGLEYNLCRVPIGGTDFSTHGYSYDDGNEDPDLLNFTLAPEDYKYKIPIIKTAQQLSNDKIELFASAWTAPKWMKNNGKYTGPDFLRTNMYQSWANYFLKFLQAYKNESISFWGITTGNEPSMGLLPSKINSVGWLPHQMRKWIAENLGPTIRNSEFASLKILAVDDQSFFYKWFIDMLFENKMVKEYIDGFGLHWYWNNLFSQSRLTETHNAYPDKFILATEACEGAGLLKKAVLLGEWSRAESYALDIIKDLNNWVTGWIDWNMVLDETGGPTYINNNVDSPIIVNATSGEFYKQPMYYALAHFTKLIPKGSQRILSATSNNKLELVSFIRPDNGTVVVIMNRDIRNVTIKIRNERSNTEIIKAILAKSIVTILY